MEQRMPKGTVKWFDTKKGFGFITSEDGTDIFVHKSGVEYIGLRRYLDEGLQVTFEVKKGPKGERAVKVRIA
jgi:CspA family cold shock protein